MDNELEKLSGRVENVSFLNNDNGFTVLEVQTGDGDIFAVVGTLGPLSPGESVTFEGSWQVHSTFGKQFKAVSCTRERPKTAADQFTYLASGVIKGVREGTARRMIEAFGERTFDVIENEPERLAKIKGISLQKAKEISKNFKAQFSMRETLIALEKYGISNSEPIKIYNIFGDKSVEKIENNPYIVCSDSIGMSFDRAETIASLLPNKPADEYRLSEGVRYVLKHNRNLGHTCVPREKLIAPCTDVLEVKGEDIQVVIDTMISNKQLVSDSVYGKEYIFLPDMYKAERESARNIVFLKNFPPAKAKVTEARLHNIEIISGIVFNDNQKKAIQTAVEQGLLILTGGPGTGKTTTLNGILKLFEFDGISVALAAPTGRAAKRMTELTGCEAKTIHRLLEVEWDKNDRPVFTRNRSNPIEADAVIVDELSMVDIQLFASLLDALPIGCRLILVGDPDQLPAVGAGNVLSDLIRSGVLPVVHLDEVFRQAMKSLIITNAHKIITGEMPETDIKDNDFFFLERKNAFTAAQTLCDLCCERLPKAYGYSPFEDIQVICPSKLGDTGTAALNVHLQSILNPKIKGKNEKAFGQRVFREGDKVMQIKNNYDLEWNSTVDRSQGIGVFNGDIGVLRSIDSKSGHMIIDFDERRVEFPFDSIEQLELAYAITVHKSQGSEFKCVVMPMTGIVEKLAYRNLLYTGVTRAKDKLIMVGDKNTLYKMVLNNKKTKRYSALADFIVNGSAYGI